MFSKDFPLTCRDRYDMLNMLRRLKVAYFLFFSTTDGCGKDSKQLTSPCFLRKRGVAYKQTGEMIPREVDPCFKSSIWQRISENPEVLGLREFFVIPFRINSGTIFCGLGGILLVHSL